MSPPHGRGAARARARVMIGAMPRVSSLARLLVCVLAAGCGGAPAQAVAPAPPAVDCGAAAGQVGDLLASNQDRRPPDEAVNQVIQRVRVACEEDGWSADARACFARMGTPADADHCGTLLTEAQTQGLLRRQAAEDTAARPRQGGEQGVSGPPSGGLPPPPPPPPPPRSAPPAPPAPPSPVTDSADPCDGGE